MRKLLLSVTLVCLCAGAGHAGTFAYGNKTITYQIPDGYVSADSHFGLTAVLAVMRAAQPPDQEIVIMYAASSAMERFEKEGILERYFTIQIAPSLKDRTLRAKDFGELKNFMKNAFGTREVSAIKKQVNEMFEEKAGGALKMKELKSLGCYAETGTSLSWLAISTQEIAGMNGTEAPEEMGMALNSTAVFTEGKVVSVNQYKVIESGDDIEPFKNDAQAVFAEMAIPQDSNEGVLSALLGEGTLLRNVLVGAVVGGLVGGLGSLIISRLRGKKSKR